MVRLAESIFAELKKSPQKAAASAAIEAGHEIYINRVLEDAEQIPAVLRELNRAFGELWTKAGGLGKFLK